MKRQALALSSAIGALALGAAIKNSGVAAEPVASAHARSALLPMVRGIDSVASPAGPGSAEPNLTTGPDGRVYMSWLEPTNPGHALKFAVHDGKAWTTPQTIVSRQDLFVNWADFPSLTVLDKNRLAAHWLQRTGTGTYAYGVRIAQSNDGGKTWGTPVIAHRDTSPTEHGFVAMWNDGGKLGAVWLDGRKFKPASHNAAAGEHDSGNEMMLMSTTLAANGTRGAEFTLDDRTCDCCQNAAAITSNGPIVAYRNRSPDEIRDIYVTRRVNGKWLAGAPVSADNWKIAACPVNGPSIAARANRVAIAWFSAPADSGRVKVAFSDNAGETFTAPVRIDGGLPAGRVDIALLPDGAALVTWVERVGRDVASVRARRVARDGKLGAPVTIASSSAARSSGFPHAAVTGDNVMFAWTVPAEGAGRRASVRVARARLTEFE